MSPAGTALSDASTVLIVDWPSPDVPEALVRAGLKVIVKGGPGPRDYAVRELRGADIVARPLGESPEQIDLLYAHRPLAELPDLLALAKRLGARALWLQSGLAPGGDARDPRGCWMPEAESAAARGMVEAAGLRYVDELYIGDAARALQGSSLPAQ